jgi:hypothetical protein
MKKRYSYKQKKLLGDNKGLDYAIGKHGATSKLSATIFGGNMNTVKKIYGQKSK